MAQTLFTAISVPSRFFYIKKYPFPGPRVCVYIPPGPDHCRTDRSKRVKTQEIQTGHVAELSGAGEPEHASAREYLQKIRGRKKERENNRHIGIDRLLFCFFRRPIFFVSIIFFLLSIEYLLWAVLPCNVAARMLFSFKYVSFGCLYILLSMPK